MDNRLEAMHRMRQSAASLQQIANQFGISRQRVGSLLTKYYGSTRVGELLTVTELARLAGCLRNYIVKLRERGVIQPAKVIGRGRTRGGTLWKPSTISTIITYIDSHRCLVCHQPLPSNRRRYCSPACYIEGHRYKNRPEEARRQQRESVARWIAGHPEQAKQIRQRSERKYLTKKSVERYHTTEYVVWRKGPIPLGTVVRVVSGTAPGRLKVEWGDQTLEVAFSCLRRIEKGDKIISC